MTIEKTAATIELWLDSCITKEQCDMLYKVVQDFISTVRFVETSLDDILSCRAKLNQKITKKIKSL